jgi:hypothetical protein
LQLDSEADPLDELVGSVDLEPAPIDDVVYSARGSLTPRSGSRCSWHGAGSSDEAAGFVEIRP